MTNGFFRTAIFKSADRNVLLLKIRLPFLNEGEYGGELSRAVNSFYRELCKCYMHSAGEAVRTEGEGLVDGYPCPLTLSVTFEICDNQKNDNEAPLRGRRKRETRKNRKEAFIEFRRTEKLYSRDGVIKSREAYDLFDISRGFLLK